MFKPASILVWKNLYHIKAPHYRVLCLRLPDYTLLSYLSRCLAAASSLASSDIFIFLRNPDPLVVRSTVSSCISIGTPSAENSRSNSTPVAPFLLAYNRTDNFSALDVFSDGVGDHKSALKPKSHSYLPYELCSLICNYYTTKLAIKPWSIWKIFYLTSKLSISVLYVLTYKWGYITVKKYSSKVYTIATKSVH